MTKRQITATAPDGTTVTTTGLGAARVVAAIRITWFDDKFISGGNYWAVTVHKTLEAAITGPNQTPEWNRCPRWAIAIDENDQPIGEWLPASK